jgi:hydrophobic/amphiphilic exporter-1 (mainly G- bacteria), HAE1 family
MNIVAPFIRRPVMTTLIMVAILLFGIMSYRLLPVSDLPNVDFPTIMVSASLPGASPETMASTVAQPLERQFSTIAGVDVMTSSSAQDNTQITIQFALTRNIDAAAQDVQAAIGRAARQLPSNMPSPPSYQKVNPADQPILFLALTGPTMPMSDLDECGNTLMAQRISMVDGVALVNVFGSQKRAVRVQLDPQELAARGIGIDEVARAVDEGNVNMPTGTLTGDYQALTVLANGQLTKAEDYRSLIVTYRNGAPVFLKELGRVINSVENTRMAAWYCTPEFQERSIVLAIQKQPGTNTVEVADAVKKLIPQFRQQIPASVTIHTLYDRSVPIRDSFNDVQFTLVLTLVLVVLVIFLFLRNASATVIPSLALPMSVVGTFVVMYALDFSLDNMSLMALTLAVGFVVDDAIVMLENIFRHMEMGKSRFQAALDGSKEVSFTIISMTLSLAAVFIPVLFMSGLIGRLFREFAITIGAAVMVSGLVSLTLTPMLASRFCRDPAMVRHGWLYNASEKVFTWMIRTYGWTLTIVLRHRLTTLAISLCVLAATGVLFYMIPKSLVPSEDQDQISIRTEAAQGISFPAMSEHQQALAEIIRREPGVRNFMSSAGARGANGGNTGMLNVRLVPRSERDRSADQIIDSLRAKLASVPGIQAFLQNPPSIPVGSRMSKAQYQFTLQGPDTSELYREATKLVDKMKELPGLLDVTTDMQLQNPQLQVNINRDHASAVGISATQVETALSDAFGTQQVSTIYTPNNQYQVIMELLPQYQISPDTLSLLYVRSGTGALVPMRVLADLKRDVGPLTINHTGQLVSVTISFNTKTGVALGDAIKAVTDLAAAELPATISTSFQGTAQQFLAALPSMLMLAVLAILVIYMVLGVLYENFFHPITILTALPFAGVGAVATLMIFHEFLSVYSFVGIIMLIGLVKKNGIMMIDFALGVQKTGKTPAEAIHEACLIRFRPIMMTTLCALMAGLPLALGLGAGAESRRPLGLAVVGGLLFSQTLTLFVTPVFYVYMESIQNFLRRLFHVKPRDEDMEPAEEPAV